MLSVKVFFLTLMSKGLGELQRRILDCLATPLPPHSRMEVEEGVYDLRRVARLVAKPRVDAQYGGPKDEKFALAYEPSPSYSAAFSRAVRSLIERGELEVVRGVTPWHGRPTTRQIRFVRLPRRAK